MNSTPLDFLRQAILFLVTPHCYNKYFIDFNFFDVSCFLATLSKCLGLVIILSSFLVKLPQISKIHKNKSGEGISMLSVTLDLIAITIYASYSYLKQFPFSAWGDSSFLALQTVLIGMLVLHYGGKTLAAILYLVGYLVVVLVLTSGLIPIGVVWTLQGCNIFILVSGKLTQALSNYKNGNTGQLSAATFVILFCCSLTRIFTSVQETGDKVVILTYIAASSANGVLVAQLWYYKDVVIGKKKVQ